MSKYKFSNKGLVHQLLMAAFIMGVSANTGHAVAGGIVAALIVLLPLGKPWLGSLFTRAPHMNGIVGADLNKEVWQERIEGNLFQDNEFLMSSVDDSQYVNYKTVHIPNAGGQATIVKDRAKGGARVDPSVRTDSEVTYGIGEFSCAPFLVTNAEEVQLSYSKMDSMLREMQLNLNDRVAEDILISWAPTGTALLVDGVTVNANILRTTGYMNGDVANAVASPAYTLGATGNRLNFTLYDVQQVRTNFGKRRVPKKGRHMLLSEDACAQLIADMQATKYRGTLGDVYDIKEGTISRLMGFEVHVRASTLIYTNAATPVVKAYGAAGAATDNEAILFWYEGYVSRAIGGTLVYFQAGAPTDYGDIFSCLVRCGGGKRRTTEVGVVALVQTAAA